MTLIILQFMARLSKYMSIYPSSQLCLVGLVAIFLLILVRALKWYNEVADFTLHLIIKKSICILLFQVVFLVYDVYLVLCLLRTTFPWGEVFF